MPILDSNRIYDGFSSCIGGVDAGRRPNMIGRGGGGPVEQCQEAENVIFRGGAPKTRPAFVRMNAIFDNPNMGYSANGVFQDDDTGTPQARNVYLFGNFQEASYYAPREGQEYIMASIGGHLYQITIGETDYHVRDIKLLRRNNKTILINYHCQADIYHLTQDGESSPIIFDGIAARRAVAGEIFTGTIMGYGMNRIVLIGPAGQIYFGDIRDGKGNGGKDVLGFTETTFLNEGFPSALKSSMGQPSAIAFIPQQDAAAGVGECLVFGTNGAAGFNLAADRATWKDTPGFQREVLIGIGNHGHRNVAVVNSDVWFRAKDGRRSYRQARAEVDKWGQIPLSTNVKQYIDNETESLLKFGSAIEVNNRLLTTSTPQPNVIDGLWAHQRLYHNGILSLDFDILSTFGESVNPAWDGRWLANDFSSLKCFQIVNGKFNGRERAFAFCIDDQEQTSLIEITRSGITDSTGRIAAYIWTRSFDFDSEFNEKSLYGGDIWPDEVAEHVDVNVRYRPDQINTWRQWHSFSRDAVGTPGAITPGGVPTLRAGYKPRQALPKTDDVADPVTNRIYRRGYEFQAEIIWTGHAAMRKFRIHAQQIIEDSKADIE